MLGFSSGFVLAGAQIGVCWGQGRAQGDGMAGTAPLSCVTACPPFPSQLLRVAAPRVQSLEIISPPCSAPWGCTPEPPAQPWAHQVTFLSRKCPPSPASGAQLVPTSDLPQQFCPSLFMWFDLKSTDRVIRRIPLVIF